MGKFGINVPKGAVVGSVQEVKEVLKNVFPSEKEVMLPFRLLIRYFFCAFCYVSPLQMRGLCCDTRMMLLKRASESSLLPIPVESGLGW
jgi:hypothetical protein